MPQPIVEAVDGQLVTFAEWVRYSRAITVLSGAGISTESGIPDFRGPQGVWTKDPAAAALSSIDAYIADPAVRERAWRARRVHPAWQAEPSAGHRALAELERSGKVHAIVTQNIDELHQRAGSDPDRVIEIHGTMFAAECLDCGVRTTMRAALDRVDAGDPDPHCLECGGLQKSATISFGQALRPEVLARAVDAARTCDLFLVLGSSLTVRPAAGLCLEALENGSRLVIINQQPTPYDRYADAVVDEPIGEVLPEVIAHAMAPD